MIRNLFKKTDKQKHAKEIWDVLQLSYEKIGGLKGSGLTSIDQMVQNIPMFKIAYKDNKVKVVFLYKFFKGRKLVAVGTDGTPEGKEILKHMFEEGFHLGRSYVECSGPLLKFICRVFDSDELQRYCIHTDEVKKLYPGIVIHDNYLYSRLIGAEEIQKMMLGKLNEPLE